MPWSSQPVIGTGISSQLAFAAETGPGLSGTWGTAPATPAWRPLEYKSETLELKKTTVQGQGLHAGGLFDRASRRVLTNYDVNGGVTADLPNRNLNILLQHMTGSPNASQTSTIYAPTQISTSGAYQSYHSPGNTAGMSMLWQKGVPTVDYVVVPFTYVGCKIQDWEISVQTGAIAQLALTIDAKNELCNLAGYGGDGDPLNTTPYPSLYTFTETGVNSTVDPLSVFHFREASVYTGTPTLTGSAGSQVLTLGSASKIANVTQASVKETHSIDTTRYYLGSSGFKAEQIENGFRQLTGTFDVEWLSNNAMYAAFAGDLTMAFQLTLVGSMAGTTGTNLDTITITVPNIKLDGESPKVAGPGLVMQSVPFTGLDDQTTAPYQIQYISSDTAA